MAAQPGGEVAVQPDDGQALAALDHRIGHRAHAGADLDQGISSGRVDGAHDRVENAGVGQEMLAEALAGNVLQ